MSLMTVVSCSNNENVRNDDNLLSYLESKTFETGAVIACAASDEDTNDVLVFYYPEESATDIRLYESIDVEIDPNEFSNYRIVNEASTPFFNGYLGKFTRNLISEKWTIVTYEFNNSIKVSNPIRLKQSSKPSVWSEDVIIDQSLAAMPKFTWMNNAFGDNAIYFQVISDTQDNLLSGTYTYENKFQYYNTSNVVLNVTTQTPPDLITGNFYKFTLMDVSIDNWVNGVIQKTFEAQ
jgi:hypothetical protein